MGEMRNSNIVNKKSLIIAVVILVFILTSAALFLPYFFAKSFAESKLKNSTEILLTVEYDSQNLGKILIPEFIIYSKNGDIPQATYLKLKRHYLVFWEIADFKNQWGSSDELKQLISENKLTPNDFTSPVDIEKIEENSTQPNYEPGSSLTEIETTNGDKIQVIIGQNQQDNELKINGVSTGIRNIYSVSVGLDEKYVYYTKFSSETLEDGFVITTADGNIHRYDLLGKFEETIYSFGNEETISFKVNSKYIFYANSKNEVGRIDLATKQKTLFDTLKLGVDLNAEVAGDIGVYTPLNILNIDDEFGILKVELPGQEPKYFRIRLSDLAVDPD